MYSLNCCRLRRGPKPKFHIKGKTSVAKNSVSAILPTSLRTFNAAIITAGSFVFIPFNKGTIFSWTVYLSNIALLGAFPSLGKGPSGLGFPPQSTTKASSPRTLIAKLLVLVNTAATTGNSSFLIVEKSRTDSMIGRHESDLSTIAGVAESNPA